MEFVSSAASMFITWDEFWILLTTAFSPIYTWLELESAHKLCDYVYSIFWIMKMYHNNKKDMQIISIIFYNTNQDI
jgi:hypothetical protein